MTYNSNQKSTGLDTLDDSTSANDDLVIIGDVSDSGRAKGITWTSIKAFLKAYFDTLYPSGSGTSTGTNTGNETTTTEGALINGATAKTTPVDADFVGLMDSAASNILKKLSWANIKATLKTYFDTLYVSNALGFSKNGTTTYDVSTASGTQTIAHGLGRVPSKVRLTSVLGNGSPMSVSFGSYDGTTNSNTHLYFSSNITGVSDVDNTNAIVVFADSTTKHANGVVTVDATNITITWTKTSTPTGTANILWEVQ